MMNVPVGETKANGWISGCALHGQGVNSITSSATRINDTNRGEDGGSPVSVGRYGLCAGYRGRASARHPARICAIARTLGLNQALFSHR